MYNLNYKPILFAITTVVLLGAIITATQYTVNAANAQENMTNATGNAIENMTNATGNAIENMTNATGNAIKGDIIREAIPPM